MTSLTNLKDTSRHRTARRRVGRGVGSGLGKTSGRGHKGAGSRSGYKRRLGYEGGQVRLFRKLPERGFSNVSFQHKLDIINLGQIDALFENGESVNLITLREKGWISGTSNGIKLLAKGELKKKIKSVEVDAISSSARETLEKAGISVLVK